MLRKRPLAEAAAAIAAAVLLSLAFPPSASADIAFFALVPLLLTLRNVAPKRGFKLGFLFGFVFRFCDLFWLSALKDNGGPLALVVFGLLALSAYCALYTAVFGFAVSCIWKTANKPGLPIPPLFRAVALLAEPLLWAGQEHLVGTVLTGFPWNPLAATQYRNLSLLSCVAVGGAGMLSAAIVAVNTGVASLLARIWGDAIAPRLSGDTPKKRNKIPRSLPLFAALIIIIVLWWRGMDRVRRIDRETNEAVKLRVAVVHPDAPCIFERDDESLAMANRALLDYTSIAGSTGPDLVIWPETSLPGCIPYDKDSAEMVGEACISTGAPLIAGGVEYIRTGMAGSDEGVIFNAAFLFRSDPIIGKPAIVSTYRKQHLVPFGEFIPLESCFPILKRLAPTGFSCEAGSEQILFEISSGAVTNTLGKEQFSAAPLICFEDVFPYLAREAASSGADVLISIANDAWFDGTAESEQHLAQAVLRAVETGLPVLRSTNRGVSAFILPNGRILRRAGSGRGSGTPGFIVSEIGIAHNEAKTFYVRHGDGIFSIPCAGLLLGLAIAAAIIGKAKHRRT